MRPGWNPIRRNRNIGTPAQGHGDDNRLTIPESRHGRKFFYERLDSCLTVISPAGTRCLHFFVEPTRPGWFHPCSIEDACRVLAHCPAADLATLDFIVMRQPTRKQRVLRPVWGRAVFQFEMAPHAGAAIVLDAQPLDSIVWRNSLTPEDQRELGRLQADGHEICKTRRTIEIRPTPATLRNTVLYRTLLHELGHHVDHQRFSADEWNRRPSTEKEDFAHRYAAERLSELQHAGCAPFEPAPDLGLRQSHRIKDEWFHPG